METRQACGKLYPPKTLYALLCGLLRVARSKGSTLNFLDKSDVRFKDLHLTMDSVCSQLHSKSIGAVRKSASVITYADEDLFWERGVLGLDNPRSLLYTTFFYVGLHFCLRGGQEQRDLSIHQFTRTPPDISIYGEHTYYEYTEYVSKNNQHRFKNIHSSNKVVKAYANVESCKCVVKILDLYLKKLPSEPKAFYLRPVSSIPKVPDKPWFINSPVGINTLNSILSTISQQADVNTQYTNHSLRATSATRMYLKNVPEKLISEKTGHRSLTALRVYERTSCVQEQAVTKANEEIFFDSLSVPGHSKDKEIDKADTKTQMAKSKSHNIHLRV